MRRVFFSAAGLRSCWRALLFAIAVFAAYTALTLPWGDSLEAHRGELWADIAGSFIFVCATLLATWVMARFIDRKPFTAFGLSTSGMSGRATIGVVVGFGALSLLLVMLWLLHCFSFGGPVLSGAAALRFGLMHAMWFTMVALTEELSTRGYLLFVITQGIGFWPAALLLSALFAAGHLYNSGEDWIGIAAAFALGVVLAWSVRRTGSLWWAIGFHAGWDWGESYFYGVPDSGRVAQGHLLGGTLRGPGWLSGGSVGPEGSALIFLVIALLAVVVRWFPKTPPEGLERIRVEARNGG